MNVSLGIRRFLLRGIIVVLFFPYLQLVAQENDSLSVDDIFSMSLEELLKIKVTVSSTDSLSVFNTPSTVTIIDHEMIEEYGFISIAEALSTVAGIDIMQTIIDKNITTSRGILQNFYANKVLLMINNIPTWQPIYGDSHLERIDINDVEQIEVLKGPASVLYGSNAYSGVVNIKLKSHDQSRIQVNGYIGYNNIGGGSLNIIRIKDDFSFMIGTSMWYESGTPYKFEGVQGDLYNGDSTFMYADVNNIRNFTLKLDYKSHSILVNNFGFNHSYFGAAPSYSSGGGLLVENNGTLATYSYSKELNDKFNLFGRLTYDYFKRCFPLSFDRRIMIYLAGYRTDAEIKASYKLFHNLQIELGGFLDNRTSEGHNTRDGISDTLIRHNLVDDKDILEWSLFGQLNYKLGWLNVLAGTRYTNNVLFGDNISSRISCLANLNESQSIKFMFGESFRVPTMFELYFNHPTVVGNQELKPETSISYELAYLVGFDKIYLQALGYYASYNNLIQRVTPNTGPPSEYRNVNSFDGYGFELEFRYQNPKIINAFINYNHLAGTDEELDNNYKYVPDHTISFGLNKKVGSFALSANGRYISEVEGHLDIIPQQFNLDAQLSYEYKIKNTKLRHALIIKNITNSDMLTAEYIRQTPNINSLSTTGSGTRIIFKLNFIF